MSTPLKLLVFAQWPAPGAVKPRLAHEVGPERAASIYRRMAQTVLATVQPMRKVGVEVRVHCDPAQRVDEMRAWLSAADLHLPQVGPTPAARVEAAFARAFADGATAAVALGTDCIEVTPHGVKRAFDLLGRAEAVVGPARDGGCYLLGLRRVHPGLLAGFAWDGETAYFDLSDRLHRLKLPAIDLERLRGIHGVEDVPTGYY